MLPTIISGGSQEQRAAEVASQLDSLTNLIHLKASKTSITIAQVHETLRSLTTTSPVKRVVWIEEADKLTLPAQNALLKALEEPPKQTLFILTTAKKGSLLETIRSRCRLLELTSSSVSTHEGQEALALVKQALSLTSGERVSLADSLGRKRDELLAWTNTCLLELETRIKSESSPPALLIYSQIVPLVHRAHLDLQANVSVPLTMQNLFLRLPRTRP